MADAGGEQQSTQQAERATRLFVSCSYLDWAFADWLAERLRSEGYDAFFDLSESDSWRQSRTKLLHSADFVLFIVSPDLVASEECLWDIQETERLGKHFIPIAFRLVEQRSAPELLMRAEYVDALEFGKAYARVLDAHRRSQVQALSETARTRAETERDELAHNYRRKFLAGSKWEIELEILNSIGKLDALWLREQTEWTARADEWAQTENPEAQAARLLQPSDVAAARLWMNRRKADSPPVLPLIREFVAASEGAEAGERDKLRRAVQRGYAAAVTQALEKKYRGRALKLAAVGAALSRDLSLELDSSAEQPQRSVLLRAVAPALLATSENYEIRVFRRRNGTAKDAVFSADGSRIFVLWDDGSSSAWDAETVQDVSGEFPSERARESETESVPESADGKRRIAFGPGNSAAVVDSGTNACLMPLSDQVMRAVFSPDGARVLTVAKDGAARLWDVSRTNVLTGDLRLAFVAALADEGAQITDADRAEPLLTDAPADIFETFKAGLGAEQLSKLASVIQRLQAPLHPGCLLPAEQRDPIGDAMRKEQAAQEDAERKRIDEEAQKKRDLQTKELEALKAEKKALEDALTEERKRAAQMKPQQEIPPAPPTTAKHETAATPEIAPKPQKKPLAPRTKGRLTKPLASRSAPRKIKRLSEPGRSRPKPVAKRKTPLAPPTLPDHALQPEATRSERSPVAAKQFSMRRLLRLKRKTQDQEPPHD